MVRGNKLETGRIGTVSPIGCLKLDGLSGEVCKHLGGDELANRGKWDGLSTATRRIHGLVLGSMQEKSDQAFGAVCVTTGSREGV